METKPRITHLITSLKVGGAEALLVDLVQELHNDGYRNQVLYFYDGPNRLLLDKMGVETVRISGLFRLYDPIFFVRLVKMVRAFKPNVIHASLWSANLCARVVGRLLGIPVLCAIHSNTNLAGAGNRNSRFRTVIDRVLKYWASRYVLVSSQMDSTILPAKRTVVIQNGVRVGSLASSQKLMHSLDLKNKFVVGAVGRFCSVKNYALLLDSFALLNTKYRDTVLVLLGQGELETELKDQAKRFGIMDKVRFIHSNKAVDYYSLFDCFVMTSWEEGLSIALLEAMSFGVPPVVVKPEGVHEVIEHDTNGLLVGHHDKELIVQEIERLLVDPVLHRQIAMEAQQTIQHQFSFTKMVDCYKEQYAQLSNNFIDV
ncbi:glycosyltransferase [bacterium]|jgi:glycosyltransferase involved in cell wall biosynthesis|nr:glycosyltransferase [bacterium]MBT5014954.1 glycosyltransferase [bacterium]